MDQEPDTAWRLIDQADEYVYVQQAAVMKSTVKRGDNP